MIFDFIFSLNYFIFIRVACLYDDWAPDYFRPPRHNKFEILLLFYGQFHAPLFLAHAGQLRLGEWLGVAWCYMMRHAICRLLFFLYISSTMALYSRARNVIVDCLDGAYRPASPRGALDYRARLFARRESWLLGYFARRYCSSMRIFVIEYHAHLQREDYYFYFVTAWFFIMRR